MTRIARPKRWLDAVRVLLQRSDALLRMLEEVKQPRLRRAPSAVEHAAVQFLGEVGVRTRPLTAQHLLDARPAVGARPAAVFRAGDLESVEVPSPARLGQGGRQLRPPRHRGADCVSERPMLVDGNRK
jgi:hypothetical protein